MATSAHGPKGSRTCACACEEELPTGKRAREVIDLDPEQDPPWQWPCSIGAVAPAPTSSAARDHLDAMLLAIAKRKGV